jgi:hypothetical protein
LDAPACEEGAWNQSNLRLVDEGNPPGSGRLDGKQTPLFVSNDDFIFSGAYPYPRFAQGRSGSALNPMIVPHE